MNREEYLNLAKTDEIIGKRFGRYVVVGFSHRKSKVSYFKCLCDCGQIRFCLKANLKRGTSSSCGCLRAEQTRKYGVATANEEYSKHRCLGRKRGLGFLSREDWNSIVYLPCNYCGMVDTRNGVGRHKRRKEAAKGLEAKWDLLINGVDRVDSYKPYTVSNCVSCCGLCNMMKNNLTVEQFDLRIKAIYENRALNTKRTTSGMDQGFHPRRRKLVCA